MVSDCMEVFYLVKFIDYQIWADNLLIEELKKLSDEQFTKVFEGVSVEDNVSHIIGTFHLWLNRMKGVSLEEFPHLEKEMSREELLKLGQTCNEEIRLYFNDEIIDDVIYRTTKGKKYLNSKEDILTHLVIHTAFYRGQIKMALKLMGIEISVNDFIHFRRMKRE